MEILQIPIAYIRSLARRVVLEINDTIVVPASLITMAPTREPLNTERAHVPVLNVFSLRKNCLFCNKSYFKSFLTGIYRTCAICPVCTTPHLFINSTMR